VRVSRGGVIRLKRHYFLLFGPLAAAILGLGIVGLGFMVPGYSQVHQTVSEIGEAGSPAGVPFAIMLFAVAACVLVFASAIRDQSIKTGHSPVAAYFVGFMAISLSGVAVFAFPHPLHNSFGLSELVAYQAPLVLAITWRGDPRVRTVVRASWILFILMWIAIGLNLATLDRQGALWAFERPFYGLVQRTLFIVWFGWCAVIGALLFKSSEKSSQPR
jgi:hypothetical membrane protein